jgi:hypothetical protein
MPGPIAPIPSPRTWASGPILAPSLRADVSDAVAFLSYRPLFAAQNINGSAVSGTQTLGVNSELYDNWNGHNGANVTQYYAQAPGWYLCKSVIPYNYTSATQALFAAGFSGLNGGTSFPNTFGGLMLSGSTHVPAAQCCDLIPQTVTGPIGGTGDFIQFNLFTSVSTTLVASLTQLPTVSLRWVAVQGGTAPLAVPACPAWATPPSFVTSAFLNANIRDTVNFLLYPPICKLNYVAGSATLPSTAFPAGTVINMGNVVVDNYGGATTGAAAGYTAPVTGNYFCYGQFNLQASATSTGYCAGLTVNGGTTQWGDSLNKVSDAIGGGATVMKRLRLTAGQQVQLVGCQGSGGAIAYNTTAANQTRLIVVWEGS